MHQHSSLVVSEAPTSVVTVVPNEIYDGVYDGILIDFSCSANM